MDSRRYRRATRLAQGTADRPCPHRRAALEAVGRAARAHSGRASSRSWRTIVTPFETCLAALRQPGPPEPLFHAVDRALKETVGHKLFTLLYVAPDGKRVKRLYTNMP